MTGLTQSLANFVAGPTWGDGESGALGIANVGFIDTIGTMMAGSRESVAQIVLAHARSTHDDHATSAMAGRAPVPYAALSLPAAQAAYVNGVTAHALDYDDVALSAHTSTVLVPAILAEGHRLGVSGLEALKAYVVGYEVWAELFAREPDPYHLKGWHPTGVFGTVGAAAAVAYLNRLPVAQTRHALAIAASMASGLVANFGTMTKPLHAGRAAACGIDAVRLSELGLTSAPDVFEHPAGFLNAISPAGHADRRRAAEDLGRTLRILDTGVSIKRYPVCYGGHRLIDGALDIAARENLRADEVREVRVTVGAAQAAMLRNRSPQTGLEAKFSAEFDIASALVARQVGLEQLTDAFVVRSDVQALIKKVQVAITERPCPVDPAFSFADTVTIKMRDGKVHESGEIRFAKGNAKNPVGVEDLRAKFVDCLAFGGQSAAHLRLYERLVDLRDMDDLRQLFE